MHDLTRTLVAGCGLALLLTTGSASAAGLDTSVLPQSCKDTLAQMQSDKGRFGELSRAMTQARKASKTDDFCRSAREIIVVIKAQSDRLDTCVGELGSAAVPENTSGQIFQLKGVYRQMLAAAKDPKNDRFKCGLADQ